MTSTPVRHHYRSRSLLLHYRTTIAIATTFIWVALIGGVRVTAAAAAAQSSTDALRFRYGAAAPTLLGKDSFIVGQRMWAQVLQTTQENIGGNTSWVFQPGSTDCIVEEAVDDWIYFRCSKHGNKQVTVTTSNGKVQQLDFQIAEKRHKCFVWQHCLRRITSKSDETAACEEVLQVGETYSGSLWLAYRDSYDDGIVAQDTFQRQNPTVDEEALTLEYFQAGESPILIPSGQHLYPPIRSYQTCRETRRQLSEHEKSFLGIRNESGLSNIFCPEFDLERNVWKYSISFESDLILAHRYSSQSFSAVVLPVPITLFKCSATPAMLWYNIQKYKFPSDDIFGTSSTVNDFQVTQDSCFGSILMIPHNGGVVLLEGNTMETSRVSFQNLKVNRVVPVGQEATHVVGIRTGLVALESSGTRVYLNRDQLVYQRPDGQPVLTGLSVASSCDTLSSPGQVSLNDIVLMWSDEQSGSGSITMLTVGFPAGNGYSITDIHLPFEKSVVRNAIPILSAETVAVLLHDPMPSSKSLAVVQLWFYNLVRNTWTIGGSIPDTDISKKIGMKTSRTGAIDEIFIWTSNSFVRTTFGLRNIQYMPIGYHEEHGTVPQNVTVKRFAVGEGGVYAALLEGNRIIVGREDLIPTMEVPTPFHADQTLVDLFVSPSETLFGVYLTEDTNGTMQLSVVEIQHLNFAMTAASLAKFSCPYGKWHSTLSSAKSYELDMGESHTFTMEIIESVENALFHSGGRSLLEIANSHGVTASVSNRNILGIRSGETRVEDLGRDMVKRVGDITVFATKETSLELDPKELSKVAGRALLKASPARTNAACTGNALKVGQLHVGCPIGRHLRLAQQTQISSAEVPSSCTTMVDEWIASLEDSSVATDDAIALKTRECVCNSFRDAVYSLDTSFIDFAVQSKLGSQAINISVPANGPVVVHYDYERFGCPLIIPYSRHFVPEVEVWDGDHFVKKVDANFVTIELLGRSDVAPAQSLLAAGCKRQVPTWNDRLQWAMTQTSNEEVTERPLEYAWLPHNHEDCFSNESLASLTNRLEIPTSINFDAAFPQFNSSSSNYLSFRAIARKVPFFFHVRVVDPSYSFCPLTVEFAVQVYAMPMDASTSIAIVVSASLFMLSFLVVTFFWNKEEILKSQKFRNGIE